MLKKEKNSYFFSIMGCVAIIVMLAWLVGIVIDIINGFQNKIGAWPIIANFLNFLAVGTLGTGVSALFFAEAMRDDPCNC